MNTKQNSNFKIFSETTVAADGNLTSRAFQIEDMKGLCAQFSLISSEYASKAIQDITYTAVEPGASGNAITIAYTNTATAGAETISVIGSAISVGIQTGVSTATQVRAKVLATAAAIALVTPVITGTAGTGQVTAGAANLTAGGALNGAIYLDISNDIDDDLVDSAPQNWSEESIFTITDEDSFTDAYNLDGLYSVWCRFRFVAGDSAAAVVTGRVQFKN